MIGHGTASQFSHAKIRSFAFADALRTDCLVAPRSTGRRGRGRPVLDPDRRRTIFLKVRFSPSEHRQVIRLCGNVPLADFLRTQSLRKRPLPADRVPEVNHQVILELRRLGNNLNQAVHLIHTGVIPPGFGEILRILNATIKAYHRSLLGFPSDAPDAP